MNNKGFTLIELLVVVSIMLLVTASGSLYFFGQISSMQLSSKIDALSDILIELDFKIDTKKIIDYKLFINKSIGSETSIIYSENSLGIDYIQELYYDNSTGNGTLSISSTPLTGPSYTSRVYEGIKFKEESIIDGTDSLIVLMNKNSEYRIEGSYSGSVLNTLYLKHISEENIGTDKEQFISISNICSDKDKLSCGNIGVVSNKRGKKSLLLDTNTVDYLYVFFEKQGLEKFIIINKD